MKDRPALIIALLLAAYWLIFPLFPNPRGSNAIGVGAVCAGIFLTWQYVETFLAILFKRERRPGWVAILCVTGIGIGMTVSGIWRLVFNRYEQPTEWIGTATSSFGLAIMMAAAFGLGLSHTLTKVEGSYPGGFWRAVLVALAIVVAFVAGQQFS